jgi:hypothetical protein
MAHTICTFIRQLLYEKIQADKNCSFDLHKRQRCQWRSVVVNQDTYGVGKSKDAVQEYRISRSVCDELGGHDNKVSLVIVRRYHENRMQASMA